MTAATPHIVPTGPIADKILLPGDPLRAQFIAQNFLDDAVQFNAVRGALGFTGTFRGQQVSVLGTGMGMPSIGIYSYELIHTFGVKRLIRVGSCGAYAEDLNLHDIVIAQAACTDSGYMAQFTLPGTFAPIGSFPLIRMAVEKAEEAGQPVKVGNVLSTDVFYNADSTVNQRWASMGVLAVEMEAAALYANAAAAGAEALAILTVSDHIFKEQVMPAEERQTGFEKMIMLALNTITA